MKRTLECSSIRIPFKEKFSHHSASREETETIIVRIANEAGLQGLGESCPRNYVTGETIESCKDFINANGDEMLKLMELSELKSFIELNEEAIDKNPAAFCGMELALLDLLAKEKSTSVRSLLSLSHTANPTKYTAVLGIDSPGKFFKKVFIYKLMGFNDFKLKISGDLKDDLRKIKLLSTFAKRIRIDTNNLFNNAEEAIHYLKVIRPYIWAVEEPLLAYDYPGMTRIIQELKLKIILDESFKNVHDVQRIKGNHQDFIPNLRISKLGGIIRTMSLICALEKENVKWILGSHVGEMSLLTKAALLISDHYQSVHAKEGGFGTYLLSEDYFYPNLKLGFGAIIKHIPDQEEKGFGIEMRMKL